MLNSDLWLQLSLLCVLAYCAGVIDAAVGGGGLIQIPALFNVLPGSPEAALLGTNKVSSVCGTAVAARAYFGCISLNWHLLWPAALAAFVMAFFGAATVTYIPQALLRPLVLLMVVVMAVYVLWKKDFGKVARPLNIGRREKLLALLVGGAIGFYDGLLGPGTGSFLIFLFIRFFAFDFLQASASAKFINIATNLAALVYFIPTGNVLYFFALPMALFNMLGAVTGARVAIKYGTGFVRKMFLILLIILICKLAYTMFVVA